MKYRSLAEAAKVRRDPGLRSGRTKIWYAKPELRRDYEMGYEWLRNEGIPIPDRTTIKQTHVKVGSIAETDPTRIFPMMQGDYWSPRGEARDLIARLGLGHTSMTVGDIIELPSGELLMVDRGGFRSIQSARGKNPFVQRHRGFDPVLVGVGEPDLYKYGRWQIEVTSWPKDRPSEWRAKATADGEEVTVFSDTGPQEALRASKIALDLEAEAEKEGEEAAAFWHHIQQLIGPTTTRSSLARSIEVERRDLESATPTARAEQEPLFEWFYGKNPEYRVKFLDRAIQYDRLLYGPKAPPGVPVRGRPRRPSNPKQPHPVVHTLKRRLLR